MAVSDDKAKIEYLSKHKIPSLLDDMITKLLERMPDDPVTFLQALSNQAAHSSHPPNQSNGNLKEADGAPRRSSLRDDKDTKEAAGGRRGSGVRWEAAEAEKPVKKAGVVLASPSEGGKREKPAGAAAKQGGTKTDVASIKSRRKEFFQSYHNEEFGSSSMRCVHIGAIALALSYLINGKKDLELSKRVTTEDVFFHARLPLHYAQNSGITLAELYDIVCEYLKNDPRFSKTIDVALVHFDTRLYEGEVDQTNTSQTGDRGPCVTLPQFRKGMERDSRDDRRIRVFNFDPYIAEQASQAAEDEDEDDDDEEEDEEEKEKKRKAKEIKKMNKAKRKNRGAFAVFAEYNAFQHQVTLADVHIDSEVKVKYRQALLTALYKSCCANDMFSKRPRGYIELRGDADQFENVQIEADDEVDNHWTHPPMIDDQLLSAEPAGPTGTNLVDVANNISPHIIAVAWGLHLIQGGGRGIEIGDIMKTNALPLDVITNDIMSLDQVHVYAQLYLEHSKLEDKYQFSKHPITTPDGVDDAAPSMSVMDLEQYIDGILKENKDPKNPEVVMLLNFDVNTAHNVLGLEKGAVPSHWGVFVSYNPDDQMLRVADVLPKKFCKYWQVPLTRLHTALIGKGFLLLSKVRDGAIPEIAARRQSLLRHTSSMRDQLEKVKLSAKTIQVDNVVRSFEYPSNIYCVSIIALALARLGMDVSVEQVIGHCGIDISFLLSDHISLLDVSRVGQYHAAATGIPASYTATVTDKGVNGAPHVSLTDFQNVIQKSVNRYKSSQDVVLVLNFNAEMIHTVQHFIYYNGGDYVIVVDYNTETQMVTCCDLNPKKFYRTWTVHSNALYAACQDEDYASKRPRGYLLVEKKAPQKPLGRDFDIRRMKNRHPFKVPSFPHINALAFAFTELGHCTAPEDIFYSAYDQLRNRTDVPKDLFSLNGLKTRISLSAMATLAQAFLQHIGKTWKVTAVPINKDDTSNTVETLSNEVTAAVVGPHILLCVYSSPLAYDTNGSVNVSVIKHFDRDTKVATLVDVNPTKYGTEFTIEIGKLLAACTGTSGMRGIVKVCP